MPRYYYDHSFHRQTRFLKIIRRFVTGVVAVLIGIGIYLIVDTQRSARLATVPSNPTEQTTAIYSAPVEVFSTKYFQFQASRNWVFIASESSDNQFVYRKFNKTLVEHEMYIHINDPVFRQAATYVLPVKSNADGSLDPADVSDHCKSAFHGPLPGAPQVATVAGVRFLCNPSGAEYKVIAGINGASSSMQLERPDGSSATYHIIYNNVKFSPDAREFIKIIDTFQTR
jgi:hypothetical protein